MEIDTAWTEINFTYRKGNRILDSIYGYHFAIPYKREEPEKFSFIFSLADKTNQMFTNGREDNTCRLNPKKLFEKIQVLLEQKNTDTSKGWMHPIITDTIIFTMLKK